MKANKKIFTVSKENQKIIQKYNKYQKASNRTITDRAILNSNATLRKLAYYLKNKSLYKITKEELQDFFSNEKEVSIKSYTTYGSHLIPFFRYVNMEINNLEIAITDRPRNMLWYKTKTKKQHRREIDLDRREKYLITREVYNKIVAYDYDKYGQTQAMWELYYLSGIRPEELQPMKIKHFLGKNEKGQYEIKVPESKTQPRPVPLPEPPIHLIRYIGNHTDKKNPEAPLFFNLKRTKKLTPLTNNSIRDRFRTIKKELKLKDTYTIRCFRRTRATIYFEKIKNKELKIDLKDMGKIFGWTPRTVLERQLEYDLSAYNNIRDAICDTTTEPLEYDDLKNKVEKEIPETKEDINKLKKQLKEKEEDFDKLWITVQNMSNSLKKQGIYHVIPSRFDKIQERENIEHLEKLAKEGNKEAIEHLYTWYGKRVTINKNTK